MGELLFGNAGVVFELLLFSTVDLLTCHPEDADPYVVIYYYYYCNGSAKLCFSTELNRDTADSSGLR